LTACQDDKAFDKTGWTNKNDLGQYPDRNKMLDDLTQNQKLKGLTYSQLIDKIGEPENNIIGDTNSIYYDIVTDYGHDIDPIYLKILEFKYDKDSLIVDFKINQTKH